MQLTHYDDEIARRVLQPVYVGRSQAELAGARPELDVRCAVDFLELFGDVERAIWASVVDDDNLPLELAKLLSVMLTA